MDPQKICDLFLGVNMFYFDVTICNKNVEVMIFDRDVLDTRSHLWSKRECGCPLIVLMNCYWLVKMNAHQLWSVTLKFE